MNIKDLLFPMIVALGITMLVQRWFAPKQEAGQVSESGAFMAPEADQLATRPLKYEIDFLDGARPAPEQVREVVAEWGDVRLSTDGASVTRLRVNHGSGMTNLIPVPTEAQRESRCFLVALDAKTPYYYRFVGKEQGPDTTSLTFEAASDEVRITKTFIVHHAVYRIDLKLAVDQLKEGVNEARVLLSPPHVPGIETPNTLVIAGRDGTVERVTWDGAMERRGWLNPKLVGADHRYFVHALFGDADHFMRRAYTTSADDGIKSLVFEGPATKQGENEWTLSFYCGPKSTDALIATSPSLEPISDQTGLLAPFSAWMLRLLKWIESYTQNYGFAIILLSLLIKLFMLPLAIRSERGARRNAEMQKRMGWLKKQYKDDKDRLAQEQVALMKEYGAFGMLGSILPSLLSLPVFIILSRVLSNAVELYGAPMLWIPDLSAPDPYYILPLIAVAGMLMQPTVMDAKQRMTTTVVGLVFGVFVAKFPAGLVLYIVTHTVFGVLQTLVLRALRLVR